MSFRRLTRGDWLAAVAALVLLLVMAMDWYSTDAGVQARKDEQQIQPRGATAGEVSRALDESARIAAEEAEQNAWQADPFPDRLILFGLLATVALALAAAWLRAAGMRFEPPWTPSGLATGVGLATALLLAARIAQKPSVDVGAVVKIGAPLGLVCLGTIVLAARSAWNAERDGSVWGEKRTEDEEAAHDPSADTDETEAISKPAPLFEHIDPPPDTTTATVVRPAVADERATAEEPAPAERSGHAPVDEDDDEPGWAPDWSDPGEPAAPAPTPADEAKPRRRGRGGKRRGR